MTKRLMLRLGPLVLMLLALSQVAADCNMNLSSSPVPATNKSLGERAYWESKAAGNLALAEATQAQTETQINAANQALADRTALDELTLYARAQAAIDDAMSWSMFRHNLAVAGGILAILIAVAIGSRLNWNTLANGLRNARAALGPKQHTVWVRRGKFVEEMPTALEENVLRQLKGESTFVADHVAEALPQLGQIGVAGVQWDAMAEAVGSREPAMQVVARNMGDDIRRGIEKQAELLTAGQP